MPAHFVTVVGSFNIDLMVRTGQFPKAGETVLGSMFRMGPGGKGSNQAVAAARLGAKVRFVGCLGTDMFGDFALETLAAEGVDTQFVVRIPDSHTGAAMILVDEGTGENWITVVPGANSRLLPEDIDASSQSFGDATVLLLQLETPLPTVEHAAALGHAQGLRVILNPAPAQAMPHTLLSKVDILTPNETELARLSNQEVRTLPDIQTAAESLLRQGPRGVIVTLGAAGVLRVTSRGARHFPGHRVEVVDTTGAGDSFNGALAAAIAAGSDLDDAIEFANAAAAVSVTRVGAASAMPALSEVERILPRFRL